MNEQEKKLMGARIRERRLILDISQEKLAEILGMKRTNIANYEAGRVIPPGNVLLDMAQIFSVSTDYILGKEKSPQTSTPATLRTWLRQENSDLTDIEQEKLEEELEDYFQMRKNRILKERNRNGEG